MASLPSISPWLKQMQLAEYEIERFSKTQTTQPSIYIERRITHVNTAANQSELKQLSRPLLQFKSKCTQAANQALHKMYDFDSK